MSHVFCLVGEPGIGKSWLFDRLTEGYHRVPIEGSPRRELLYETFEPPHTAQLRAIELGARRGRHPEGYPGTDAMSMTAIVDVHSWLAGGRVPNVPILAEGARLSVGRLIRAVAEGDHEMSVILIEDQPRAELQRARRGSQQKPSWIAGARTRARNFYELACAQPQTVSAYRFRREDPELVLGELRRITGL